MPRPTPDLPESLKVLIKPKEPLDRYTIHNGIISGICNICGSSKQRRYLFFGESICVNPYCKR